MNSNGVLSVIKIPTNKFTGLAVAAAISYTIDSVSKGLKNESTVAGFSFDVGSRQWRKSRSE